MSFKKHADTKQKLLHCKQCDVEYLKKGNNNTFCSKKCYKKYYNDLNKQYHKNWQKEHPVSSMLRAAKHRAVKNGIEFDITKHDLVLPEYCPILGIKLEVNQTGSGGKDSSYSLDRIDNTQGYIKGNVQIISHKANSMKFTANRGGITAICRLDT